MKKLRQHDVISPKLKKIESLQYKLKTDGYITAVHYHKEREATQYSRPHP